MLAQPSRRSSVVGRLALLASLLLAAGLRFYRLSYQSYWNDEGNTRVLIARDVPTLLRNTAADIHPPGYYLILKAWRGLAGESEFALRGFSALAGVILVALLWRLGREWFGPGAGRAAALLGAVNPFLIYYSQEARMYALLAMLSAASFLLFSRLWPTGLGRPGQNWPRPDWSGQGWSLITVYSLTTALGLYTHYAFGFVVIAQNLAALLLAIRPFYHSHPDSLQLPSPHWLLVIRHWSFLQLLTLLLYLPWLPTAYRQLTGWPAAREFHPLWDSLLDLARYLAFGRTLPTGEALWGLAAAGGLAAIGVWRLVTGLQSNPGPSRRLGPPAPRSFTLNPSALILLLWLLVPAGLTLAFGLLTEAFSKFLLVAVPPLCLLLGVAISHRPAAISGQASMARRLLFPIGHWSLVLGVICFTALSLANLYFNPAYFRDDYRGIAQYLAQLSRPGDAVLTNSPNQVEAFAYYHRADAPGAAPLFPLPDSRPLDPARTAAQLTEIAGRFDRIFVLYWGDAQADPERFIESWLNANTFKAGDQWFGQVRLATYASARPATEPATPADARFGEHIRLLGYTLRAAGLAPGDIVQVTFFWRTDAPLAARYKVFVHLYADVNAPPVAQQDGEPGGGLALTTTWAPGARVIDNHGVLIPPDLPSGPYQLLIGLYDLVSGARLPVTVGDTIIGDRLDLGQISLR